MSEAITIVSLGKHDPLNAHNRVKSFYNWSEVAERTEKVYQSVISSEQRDLWVRIQR